MLKHLRMLILGLVVLGLVGLPSAASAQDGGQVFLPMIGLGDMSVAAAGQKPAPPNSDAFGKSLEEWQFVYWDWFIPRLADQILENTDELNMGTLAGKTFLMPVFGSYPNDSPNEVEVSPGTAFMLPIYMWFGYDYLNGTRDLRSGAADVADSEVLITLDDVQLLCANRADCEREADLADYYTAGDYAPPYSVPLFGVDFIWFEGLGLLLHPLSVGEHELRLVVQDEKYTNVVVDDDGNTVATNLITPAANYDNTWIIKVTP